MKRFFRFVMAAAVLFGAVACSQSPVEEVVVDQEVTTKLTIGLENLGTRLAGDSGMIDKVAWGVYNHKEDGSGEFLIAHSSENDDIGVADFVNGAAEIEITLFTGKKYDLVFWGYCSSNTAYSIDWENRALNVNYADQKANVEANDAFFHIENGFRAGQNQTFTLRRPFAQLNVGQTYEDYNIMQLTGNSIVASSVVAQAYNSMSLVDGSVSGLVDVELLQNALVADDLTVSGIDYKHLAMNYLLVNTKEVINTVTFQFLENGEAAEGNGTVFTREYYNIPLQRNYRTNILGSIISDEYTFEVIIDERFCEPNDVVFHAFQHGGEVTLQSDMEIGHTLYVREGVNAVLNLNGKTLKNHVNNLHTDVIVVEKGATLIINGEGTIEAVSGNDGYAVISEGTLIVNGGTFKAGVDANGEANAVLYARGEGKIYVNGGNFPNENNSVFVLNKKDADRATTVIEVKGGTFYGFNPENNAAEGADTNFVAAGYKAIEDSTNVWIVMLDIPFVDKGDYAEVYNTEGLLKWAYIAQNIKKNYGMKLMNNITLPLNVVAADDVNQTYVYTDEAIVVENGIPSGSNWPKISDYERALNAETNAYEYYGGAIEGNNKTISGLRINHDLVASGFLCWTKEASVKNLTFNDAVVYNKGGQYGETYTGVVIGRCWDGSYLNNVHITASSVYGKNEVGGLVGRVYHRTIKADGTELREKLAYVVYCSTDKYTTVKGNNYVGGICGMNYGCVVGNCVNNADVTGSTYVAGLVGYHRSYTTKTDAYLLGCCTTAEATITATASNGIAGGLVGYTIRDNNHLNTKTWTVGCSSESTVSAAKVGSLVGHVSGKVNYSACWALTDKTNFKGSGSSTPEIVASYNYTAATNATQADVDAMNAAIEAFNVSDHNVSLDGSIGATMLRRWTLTASGPVLQ